jgi:hypothetical protein
MLVDSIFAGAQQKHFLQQLDGFFHRPCIGIGAEITVLAVNTAPVINHARCMVRGDLQIRVAFVIAKQNIKARMLRFNEIVLQQQGFGFAAHHGGFHPRNA